MKKIIIILVSIALVVGASFGIFAIVKNTKTKKGIARVSEEEVENYAVKITSLTSETKLADTGEIVTKMNYGKEYFLEYTITCDTITTSIDKFSLRLNISKNCLKSFEYSNSDTISYYYNAETNAGFIDYYFQNITNTIGREVSLSILVMPNRECTLEEACNLVCLKYCYMEEGI